MRQGTNSLTFSADTLIGGWAFNAGAQSYTFTSGASHLQFDGAGIVTNGDAVTITIVNTIGSVQFLDASTAGSAAINNAGILSFFGTSTAGTAVITNSVTGSLVFNGSSTAANAVITDSGNVNFVGNSSAGNATIANNSFNMNFKNSGHSRRCLDHQQRQP